MPICPSAARMAMATTFCNMSDDVHTLSTTKRGASNVYGEKETLAEKAKDARSGSGIDMRPAQFI
jgi:hypothetical protein